MSSVDAPVRGPSNNAEDIDPADFVRSIRLLSEKRDREDTERYKRLQEEVEKGRAERAARVGMSFLGPGKSFAIGGADKITH